MRPQVDHLVEPIEQGVVVRDHQEARLALLQLPEYVVDLDAPPEARWANVTDAKAPAMRAAVKLISEYLSPAMHDVADTIAAVVDVLFADLGKEMRGLAKGANMKARATSQTTKPMTVWLQVGDLVLFNLAPEFLASCTSLVVEQR